MKIEPKMAIACRDKFEIKVALQLLENAGILWPLGDKPTSEHEVYAFDSCRLYIYPPDNDTPHTYMLYQEDADDFSWDDEEGFEWKYFEASDIFRNQIISERRKNVT